MTYKEAARLIASDYTRRKQAYQQDEQTALEQDAEFLACEKELRALLFNEVQGKPIDKKKLAALQKSNAQMRKRLGLVPPAPACKICNDTGRHNGKFCECVVRLSVQNESNVSIPLHDFEAVDFSVYGEHEPAYRKLFDDVRTICTLYPKNKKRCIVLSGNTGNGKTYLAGCAANEMLQRGMSVLALTAFAANNRFLKYHTCFDADKASYLDPMLDCTLLIIDDLGTESILKNVTNEYLYLILNERNLAGKLTLFTTNLTPNAILNRYGDRIYSRLFDKSLTYAKSLSAPDIRKAF
ncbi:MAG: ATP-binding protein [Clostridiales bacterium]|nr:ATP-binding protein [Clostridiales bacterium]